MRYSYIIITLLLLFFVTACDKKEKKTKEDNSSTIESEAMLSENLERPFFLTLSDGTILNLQKNRDDYSIESDFATLFVFFTTKCKACLVETPILNNISFKFQDDLQIIGVMLDDIDDNKSAKFIEKNSIAYPISRGEQNKFLLRTMGEIENIPYMVFFDKSGKRRASYLGVIPQEMLEKELLRYF
ncbi:TlpA disulfide reductase family protein [uncultured Campylobacter sp.]|uniref:TlpA family protein disulfide reductase n=1 Tax=uncultured Campylobacter sp. TaxID=218934 RepID=UPI00262E13B3|nr:TlpA disulfide reductase family protein [uncultured Campylobacter sp.]